MNLRSPAADLPTGTVTFLFTDIEGSTRRWRNDPSMVDALARHDELLREAIESREGHWVKHTGDGVLAVFASASSAAEAAVEVERALEGADWGEDPLRVRIGLHTGEAAQRDGDYFGPAVNAAARIMDAAHGGQVLASQATTELIRDALPQDATLADLGPHRLKDLGGPQRLFTIQAPDLRSDFPPLRTLEGVPNNLPLQRTAFIGREGEIARVRDLLETHHLVTLTGIGGCGKTRLALQVGAEELDRFPDGVFFVDLAPLSDPALVPRTVADAVGLQLGGGLGGAISRPLGDLLTDALARRRCLLVLDNCEHLLDPAADVADRILASCPEVRMLATSREALEVEGEQVYRVPSLSVPDEDREAAPSEAVDLFVERARSADPDFALDAESLPSVAQACRRLDGIPLAIEFAAARVTHLTPQAIAERLDDRFRLLTGGRRRVRRQQTLEAALDWSHDLLDEAQQTLLRRLAVFAGSFGLPMAEEVCSGDGIDRADVLDLLASLVDKSLVATEAVDGEPRYRLLETVRSYAEEKLQESGEAESHRSRHRDAYLDWLESKSWEESVFDADVYAAIVREHDNLRVALEWSRGQSRRDLVGRLAARAHILWQPGEGHGEEGRRWLEWALEHPDELDPADQAACLVALADASMTLGDPEQGTYAARAIELGRSGLGGQLVQAYGMHALGASTRWVMTRDPEAADEARSLAEEGIRRAEELGDPWPILALLFHGETLVLLGDIEGAERSYSAATEDRDRWFAFREVLYAELSTCRALIEDAEGALDAARRQIEAESFVGRTQPWSYLAAALAEALLGATSEAASDLETAIDLAESEGVFLETNECFAYAGAVAFETGAPESASRLLAAASSVGDARDTPIPVRSPSHYALVRYYIPLVREALGPEEARRCRDEGRAMSVDEAVAAVRRVAQSLRERTVSHEP